MDLSVTGDPRLPTVTGFVRIPEPARLSVRALPGREVLLTAGTVELKGDRIVIAEKTALRAQFDDGFLALAGEVVLDGFVPTDAKARVRARRIEWREPKFGVRVVADGDLVFEGHALQHRHRELVLGGRVDLREGEVRMRKSLLDVRGVFDPRVEVQGTGLDPSSPLAALKFRDLAIVGRDSLDVKTRVQQVRVHVEVAPQLTLEGTPLAPVLHGAIQTLPGGRVRYSQQQFEVTRGVVEFDEAGKPVFDLEAEAEIQRRLPPVEGTTLDEQEQPDPEFVTLILKGTLDDLDVRLESRSGLDPADVVTLVATGMLRSDLQNAAAGGGGEQAFDWALAPLFADIERVLQEGSGVDILELAPNLQAKGVQIRVGTKALEGHLSADVTSTVGETQGTKVKATLKLTDHLWLDVESDIGDSDDASQGRGKLRYRHTFE